MSESSELTVGVRISAAQLAANLGNTLPTPEQAEVIEAPLEPIAVIAGAGAGKTSTMAARVVWLVANRLVEPDRILGLTFTRKAAAELSQRIRKELAVLRRVTERDDPDDQGLLALLHAQEPTVSTYAAYAGRLVGEQALRVGREPDARLLAPAVLWQVADRVVHKWSEPLEQFNSPASLVKWVLAMAGQFADHLVTAEQVEDFCLRSLEAYLRLEPGPKARVDIPTGTADYVKSLQQRLALVKVVEAFQAEKGRIGAVDFGDQMRVAAELAWVPEVAAGERERYAAVLLDEYQDTGHSQIRMLRGIFGEGHPVTAVGDALQSIYGWRGASAGNMRAFKTTFAKKDGTPATERALSVAFRNDAEILTVANTIAAPLRDIDRGVELRPRDTAGEGFVATAFLPTIEDEAGWVARRVKEAWDDLPPGNRTAAVLCRKRSPMPLLAAALREQGLDVEIVGLGGLLTTPEVTDVVATLKVLADHDSSGAVMRLLTGARWRIGARDLWALRERARRLVATPEGTPEEAVVPPSLLEALDDLGFEADYSPEGWRRLTALSRELGGLRRRLGVPLVELVAEVEAAIGVGIEVQARHDRERVGRVHLDRFLEEAAEFTSTRSAESANGGSDGIGVPTLRAFLAYLEAAEEEEYGLEAGEVEVLPERVQLITVHGAKGLEWDIVAVPGLMEGVFPSKPERINWARSREQLPAELRGDRASLPVLDLNDVEYRAEYRERLEAHHDEVVIRHVQEERRLAYVAVTRPRNYLFVSGYAWDDAVKAREPSRFFVEIAGIVTPSEWYVPEPEESNPLSEVIDETAWPLDPLRDRGDIAAGAVLVREAMSRGAKAGNSEWREHVAAVLAEAGRTQVPEAVEVDLPAHLSVSDLVELERDPVALARRLYRPLPTAPAPWTRRGTAFHTWLERKWEQATLLDIDELPGSADEFPADDARLLELQASFEQSQWAGRTPTHVEVPFEMALGGAVIRGRMDAVFGSAQEDWHVVDWKTGRRPTGADAKAAAIQLATYRLAWAHLNGIPDDQIDMVQASFHYVASNDTVSPTNLLTADDLRALITGS
ncbi:MAG TPA: ATP-dependent DNA helicase [Jatrophihabitans sp.]